MGVNAPFTKNRFNCEILLKSADGYLSQSDLDRTLLEWVRTVEEEDDGNAEMRQKVDALIQTGQDEGVKSVVAEKSKSLLCMMEYMSAKQILGNEKVRAHDIFIPLHHTAIRTRDSVIRQYGD